MDDFHRLDRLDPMAGDAWDSAVLAHPGHTVFHRSAWARVLVATYRHRPFYFKCPSGQALVPLMEVASPLTGRRGISLPFADFAGPLCNATSRISSISEQLVNLAAERKWRWLEIRDDRPPEPLAGPHTTYQTHDLDLRPGLEELERGLDPPTGRSLRQSRKGGLEIRVEASTSAILEFYALHGRTRRRHGLPPQPIRFFREIGRHLFETGLGFVVLASHGGRPVAGAVFLHSGGNAIYKFGASDAESWHLRPNQAVMWEGIRRLYETGCHTLNFGRTASGDDGLRRFKLSWGCTERPLRYFRNESGTWVRSSGEPKESHPLLFSRLPIALNRIAGNLIYPHLD